MIPEVYRRSASAAFQTRSQFLCANFAHALALQPRKVNASVKVSKCSGPRNPSGADAGPNPPSRSDPRTQTSSH